jgi:toxin ParE1/3/4
VRHVQVGRAARADIDELVRWYEENAGTDVATRLAAALIETYRRIAASPGLGAPVTVAPSSLTGLRKRPLPGFPMLLVLCLPEPGAVRVIRVLHAARDWPALLDEP